MKNIFEGAKFGNKFVTKDGRIALFDKFYKTSNEYHLYIEDGYDGFYSKHGDYINEDYPDENYDIVSKYQESIDEQKLDELANKEYPDFVYRDLNMSNKSHREAYKAGYREANEG